MLAGSWEWEDEQYRRGSSRNPAEIDRDQIAGNRKVFAFGREKISLRGQSSEKVVPEIKLTGAERWGSPPPQP